MRVGRRRVKRMFLFDEVFDFTIPPLSLILCRDHLSGVVRPFDLDDDADRVFGAWAVVG
jgi:hypothetical protein